MLKDIRQQKQFKLLLIGETCLDIYVKGEVSRLSPEAPVPVLLEKEREVKLGMLGNVSNNLKSIMLNSDFDIITNDKNKIKKTRLIDSKSNYQMIRLDEHTLDDEIKISDIPEKEYDAIVISDYNKGFIGKNHIQILCDKFKDTKVFVDTKKKDLSCFKNCLIKINESEYKNISHFPDTGSELIITKGDKGCQYKGKTYSVEKVDVHDVCGAGDVFLASFVTRYLETNDMLASLKTANRCASLSVTKAGCYTIKREEYEDLCI